MTPVFWGSLHRCRSLPGSDSGVDAHRGQECIRVRHTYNPHPPPPDGLHLHTSPPRQGILSLDRGGACVGGGQVEEQRQSRGRAGGGGRGRWLGGVVVPFRSPSSQGRSPMAPRSAGFRPHSLWVDSPEAVRPSAAAQDPATWPPPESRLSASPSTGPRPRAPAAPCGASRDVPRGAGRGEPRLDRRAGARDRATERAEPSQTGPSRATRHESRDPRRP